MDAIQSLIQGYKTFRAGTYRQNEERYRALAKSSQHPKAMIIACCDSRADPAMIFSADPGELFVVRNVANLVPPYEPDTPYHHGTSAALEFGITGLNISELIVMGHASCGGIRALYEGCEGKPHQGEFISSWMSLARPAAEEVKKNNPDADPDYILRQMEQRTVLTSLEMLRTFPFINEREKDGRLRLHGWFYGIGSGLLSIYDPATDRFENVSE